MRCQYNVHLTGWRGCGNINGNQITDFAGKRTFHPGRTIGRGRKIIRHPRNKTADGYICPVARVDFVGVYTAGPAVINVVAHDDGVGALVPCQSNASCRSNGQGEQEQTEND